MLATQQKYVDFMKNGRTPELTEAARKNDKTSHATLNALRSCAANAECFDCTAKKPGWAALPHGIFVCIDCAQIHRHLGRHISQTKAVNTGTYLWFEPEIEVMKDVGNAVAERAFAHMGLTKPSRDDTPERKLAYVQAKYAGSKQPDWAKAKELSSPPRAPAPTPPMINIHSAALNTKKRGMQGAKKSVTFALAEPPSAPAPKPPPTPAITMMQPIIGDLIDFSEPPKRDPNADFFAQFGL